MNTKVVFVSGGVISGIGKGIATSSIALLLKSRGFNVTAMKADPYLNVDAGTLNPIEHGEVFVLDDGMECDQDLGNYERFLNQNLNSSNYMTTGQIFKTIIEKERALEYEGKTVEFFQDPPREIIDRVERCAKKNKADIIVFEIGGTVGEYQNLLFLEANRLLKLQNPSDAVHVHLTYLPIPSSIGEMKSKPAQMSIQQLASSGIPADFVLARSTVAVDAKRKEKIAIAVGLHPEDIISAPDVENVYQVPLNFENQGLSSKILDKLELKPKASDLSKWKVMVNDALIAKKTAKIAMVGKYFTTGDFTLSDAYLSVIESIKHAAAANGFKPKISWIDSTQIETEGVKVLAGFDGIVVPGGFGSRAVEGIITAIKFARESNLPYFGLCYGMQLAAVEFARNVLRLTDANTTEINPSSKHPIIDVMADQKDKISGKDLGGTMRLGSWDFKARKGTIIEKAYKSVHGSERHRHRYEFNNAYREKFEKEGMIIAATTRDNKLVESLEIGDHPFFLGVQFHPELKSRPLNPHPLYMAFLQAIAKVKNKGKKKK
ncbi:CTP synthase [Candidatus Curtissbacteria bacterium RIFCSPLOWO2_01_FULL_39_62]|uniref:CTP synthase n=2 Tax=Candidatus Curtissiibacteriota TaxID=1752717 RepID=A0A1F5G999_9BACT|nr:MAG: CTP synthase [Candidatus Curtissbacteria bacterium RIFCSPHIGHO2_01_FULL_39_57]OGD88394.1 MAG: CTP synthase [Candidatus Curtissbacteria bacterium RIFCSPHIGHO2_02_FULL_40_16b]OGD90541.1 MAG: CTP synthase [Candidatus Curtissbacteria bacterium RIFCSPHIGHO2_12_FULL_38_37]OGD99752.1 MAG: CTP synthase [Candidatus Curtissbacteria bacterium RIFCSPLOWO2_02_FULL_40_11]OGE02618.1 MAG: CTP synthase [Candidatus Curtissbacteria bacterium RIFCSPLOWO2_01_FULL_39_62]OGE13930.1 MAG: CTP synthase [Candida